MLAVVSDSSPLIYLTRLELLPLLGRLHDKVIIPQAVWQEVVVGGHGLPESANLRRAVSDGWIEVQAPQAPASSLGAEAIKFGRGEVDAILLAKELRAILLTDDGDARAFAETVGLSVSGTIGILVRAKCEGHAKSLKSLLDRLRTQTNFRISEQLYRDALREGGELQDSQGDSSPE